MSVEEQEVETLAVEAWGARPGSLRRVRDSINVVYRFEDVAGHGFFLRISHRWEVEKLYGAADFARALHTGGAPVATPIPWFTRIKNLAIYAWEIGSCGTPWEHPELAAMRAGFGES